MSDDEIRERKSKELEEKATAEAKRLKSLLFNYNIPERKIGFLEDVIKNVSWMKVKLDVTMEKIKTSDVCIPYDNGGGQTGMRENPLFKGYESLFKSYMSGMKQILDVLPKQIAEVEKEEIEKPQTMLDFVRNKHKKE